MAVSASADSVAKRLMDLLGFGDDPRMDSFEGRAAHRDEVDGAVLDWIAARPLDEVMVIFEELQIAAAPILDTRGLIEDPHAIERKCFTSVEGMTMQNLVARMSATPGKIRWAGRSVDADGEQIRRDGWGEA